jgi:Ca2+-binding EF-hand superfamily protein
MGNDIGRTIAVPLGIRAVAYTTSNIEAEELTQLTEVIVNVAKISGNIGNVTRAEFEENIKSIAKLESSDIELLTSIFTMFDTSGEGVVVIKEFIAGVAGSITNGSSAEKLKLALNLYCLADDRDTILRGDLRKVLNSINEVISYFGDPVIAQDGIETIVFECFNPLPSPSTPMAVDDAVNFVIAHPVTDIFLAGQGKIKYAAK